MRKVHAMKIYDLLDLKAEGYGNRNANVFFENDLLKTRVIVLEPGQRIPECKMDSFVIFYVVKGQVLLKKNEESAVLNENQVFISEPALLSMETTTGARLMGVQIRSAGG
jgi:hypothetical protein